MEIADALGVDLDQIVPSISFLKESQGHMKLQKDVEKELKKFDVHQDASDIVTDFIKLSKSKF